MSIFNQKSKFRVQTEVRKIKQPVEKKPKPTTTPRASSLQPPSTSSARSTPRASPIPPHVQAPKRKTSPDVSKPCSSPPRKRRQPASARASPAAATPLSDSEPGSDDDDDWRERLDPNKRAKRARTVEDPDRRLRHPRLWSGRGGDERPAIVHAADVASLKDKCQPVMKLARDEVGVQLRYPGSKHMERYELVWGKDKIDGALDIMKVVRFVASTYLTNEQAKPFLDQDTGIHRRLEKSKNTQDGRGFKAALEEYNSRILALQEQGVIARNIDSMRGIPPELVEFILDQVYDRTVAPKVDLLTKYENGTDNVYGELLHPFVTDIFDRTKLSSGKVFVDLGSGAGSVTLQAALERGCESWGCEVMENACNLAEAQQREFAERCRLWGLSSGSVHLERGDFRKNEGTLEALKRADVVLVNNQAFTSQLNDHLVNMFLDLKVGCKIVSLKTFVHDNKIAENDVASSILEVEHLTYPEGYVSWTGAGGTFCISTRK
ncbi:hypothetical protein VTJ83DRAFT_866 [Remersonia thermophila]|uniref:Histone-lysine N-methyltransferase, H3 lysine-79 specific n=1 Tax=Remersonia thermophila TaxID=72144 RepID=A0ABR4DMH0_9PEZI